MTDLHDAASSQTLLNWIGGVVLSLLSALGTVGAWIVAHYVKKIDDIEKEKAGFSETYATRAQVADLELRMAQTVSRNELAMHMTKLSEERQRMHEENLDRLNRVSADVSETRDDIRAVHSRIDELLLRKL